MLPDRVVVRCTILSCFHTPNCLNEKDLIDGQHQTGVSLQIISPYGPAGQ